MKIIILTLILFLPLSSFSEIAVGVAKNQKGEILYKEKHSVRRDKEGYNTFIQVEYSKPDGEKFATMTSDFSKNKRLPETDFEDSRFKTKTTLRLNDD